MSPYSIRRLIWGGPVSTLAAILAVLLYYGITKSLGEQYLIPIDGVSSLHPMPVLMPVIVILIPGLVATVFFGLLIRFSHAPATVFLSVCVAALILSFGGPTNLPIASWQTKILLCGMNIIASAIITGGILLLSRQETQNPR
jgi:Family of unknown function (DUF6069)